MTDSKAVRPCGATTDRYVVACDLPRGHLGVHAAGGTVMSDLPPEAVPARSRESPAQRDRRDLRALLAAGQVKTYAAQSDELWGAVDILARRIARRVLERNK